MSHLPPSGPWHCELEEVSSTTNNRTRLSWSHWYIEGADPNDPFFITNKWKLRVYLYPEI